MRRIIAVLLENEAGALSRVVGLFAQRNYNIETLTVAPTEDATLSRLTVTTTGDASKIEQITKQLNKLIEVVKVMDMTDGDHVERELMLIKLRAEGPCARGDQTHHGHISRSDHRRDRHHLYGAARPGRPKSSMDSSAPSARPSSWKSCAAACPASAAATRFSVSNQFR